MTSWVSGMPMIRRRFVFDTLYCLALGLSALAGVPVHAADSAAGKEKAELCVGCHGEGGISQTENIPSLASQPDQFIQWQLVFFRGSRWCQLTSKPFSRASYEWVRKQTRLPRGRNCRGAGGKSRSISGSEGQRSGLDKSGWDCGSAPGSPCKLRRSACPRPRSGG